MLNVIDFTPHINERLIERLGIGTEEFIFCYQYSFNKERELKTKYPEASFMNDILFFEDPQNEWDPDMFNLRIQSKITIANPIFFFKPHGPVQNYSKIGLAVIWSCKSVSLRGVEKLGIIDLNSNNNISLDIDLNFEKGTLKNELNLSVIAYLEDDKHSGLNIGELFNHTIIVEGNGSVFPIVEVKEKGLPLWWVDIEWVDPQEDEFSEEFVKLCINRDHPNYKKVFTKGSIADTALFTEIMASTLQIIIEKAMGSQYWNNIIQNYNNRQGSIAEAVYYFVSTFEWDYSSPELLSKSIRAHLEKNM